MIVGILTAVALPLYTRYQERSYAAQAMADLGVCAQALERHYTTGFTYANSTAAPAPPAAAPLATICASTSPPSGDVLFNITITAADATAFTLRATPVAAGRADPVGMLEIDASGARRWDRNDDNDFGDADENNWDI